MLPCGSFGPWKVGNVICRTYHHNQARAHLWRLIRGSRQKHQEPPAASRPEVEEDCYFFWGGTGMPGIFTLTAPRWFRLVK
jgi:hypothetical protein